MTSQSNRLTKLFPAALIIADVSLFAGVTGKLHTVIGRMGRESDRPRFLAIALVLAFGNVVASPCKLWKIRSSLARYLF